MLYLVHMNVEIPNDFDRDAAEELKRKEKEMSQQLQREGTWRHLWRVAGQYANYSVFDVQTHDELHDMISALPLFPFMQIRVIPLAQHPSAIAEN
jgi:muconolactone D-isomerase